MVFNKIENTLLTDLQLFGNINYYRSLEGYNKLIFEQYKYFEKGSYSNRYYIAGANGMLLLSVPLLQAGRHKTAIKDLRICNRAPWQALHWKSLTSAYRRSPWFDFYEDELSVMYNKKYNFILDWNLNAFQLVSKWLRKEWHVIMTEEYRFPKEIFNAVDERNRFSPKNDLRAANENALYYPQVFEEKNGFLPNLSILDLLFCEGNNAGQLLAKNK